MWGVKIVSFVSIKIMSDVAEETLSRDEMMASECSLSAVYLQWLEDSIVNGTAPADVRELLEAELQGVFDNEAKRYDDGQPNLCVSMHELSVHGNNVLEKNKTYTATNHAAMAEDLVRVVSYRRAISKAMREQAGGRALDVGSGPFMLLGRMAHHAGASYVACVEHSADMNKLATQVVRSEACATAATISDPGCRLDALASSQVDIADGTVSDTPSTPDAALMEAYDDMLGRYSLRLQPIDLHFPTSREASPSTAAATTSGTLRPMMRVSMAAEECAKESAEEAAEEAAARELDLFHGLSSETALPGGFDLIVHELLGHVASAEGAIRAINELKGRPGLAASGCRVIPAAATTLLVPTSVHETTVVERLLMYQRTGYWAPQVGKLYSVEGLPMANFLAMPQMLEHLHFNSTAPIPMVQVCIPAHPSYLLLFISHHFASPCRRLSAPSKRAKRAGSMGSTCTL